MCVHAREVRAERCARVPSRTVRTHVRSQEVPAWSHTTPPPTPALPPAEELVRLPGCFLCYTPAPDAPPVAPAPAAANGFVTFGSFNALAKETPEVGCCLGGAAAGL